jgi:predicted RNA-binding Zn-ribbon protein involved in translation (DUF1610 family)
MIKGARARERVFAVTMWVVSVILASFLVGLGGLIIGDLPRVSEPFRIEQFIDQPAAARLAEERERLRGVEAEIETRFIAAEQTLTAARNDRQAGQVSFDNWVATRTATTDPAQDTDLIARTRALDALVDAERAAEQARTEISAEQNAHRETEQLNEDAQKALETAAYPAFERERFLRGLRVFGFRLAFTLPLLVIAGLFLLQKKKGDYWPLQRGFILFAAFAFFVELVPYLPEYGGYVRYGVGIVLTLLAGHFVIKWMRAYLRSREVAETKVESERKRAIQYDEALKKMSTRACPGCDRALASSDDAATDFCMHCGMQLFDHCAQCTTRKFAFFRYCMKCGAPAAKQA